MKIYIPTRGRATVAALQRGPLLRLSRDAQDDTSMAVHADECTLYSQLLDDAGLSHVRVLPLFYADIAQKREMIGEHARATGVGQFLMVDDDVDFLVRRGDDDWRLRAAEPAEVDEMLEYVERALVDHASVGISSREGNNRAGVGTRQELLTECTRVMRVLAYKTADFMSVEHCRVPVMEDFDVQLQLLRSGRKNALLSYWANGQSQTQAPGGCALWRTHEMHEAAAHRLCAMHSPFVRLRQKANKTDAKGFGTRTEVTVQWKRAYQSSQVRP